MKRSSPYPTVSEMVHLDDGMGSTFGIHRALKSMLYPISIFLSTISILYLIEFGVTYLLGAYWNGKIPIFGGLSFRWTAIVPIIMLLEIVRRYNDHLYVFERDKIMHHAGLLSLTYNVPAIRYSDIRAIHVKQGIIGRILNFGDIEICTAAQDRTEILITGIHAPLSLANFIEEMRSWHIDGGRAVRQVSHREQTADTFVFKNEDNLAKYF
jgi:membrane protein YdbS with pleckstrin-like domain